MAPSRLGCAHPRSHIRPPLAVAKQARDLGTVALALKAVQARLAGFKKSGTGGWGSKDSGLLGALRSEQPRGEVRDGLTELVSEMDTAIKIWAGSR